MSTQRQRGFTLLEIMVVIVILCGFLYWRFHKADWL